MVVFKSGNPMWSAIYIGVHRFWISGDDRSSLPVSSQRIVSSADRRHGLRTRLRHRPSLVFEFETYLIIGNQNPAVDPLFKAK